MSIPNFCDTVYLFEEVTSSDGATVLVALYADLVTMGWTNTTGTTYRSPTRDDGVYIDVKFAVVSGTKISFVVKDHYGNQVNNDTTTRQVCVNPMWIFCGPYHIFLASPTTVWFCGLADCYPEGMGDVDPVAYASGGPLTNADATTYQYIERIWVYCSATARYSITDGGNVRLFIRAFGPFNPWFARYTMTNSFWITPVELADGTSATSIFKGRFFQTVWVPYDMTIGQEVWVPIDDTDSSIIGKFKVIASSFSVQYGKFAVRFA